MEEDNQQISSLNVRSIRLYIAGHTIAALSLSLLFATINWDILDKTDSMRALGLVGLVQVLPIMGLVFPAGWVVDRYRKKSVLLLSCVGLIFSTLLLCFLSRNGSPLKLIYLALFLFGVARAFFAPAKTAFFLSILPEKNKPKLLSLNSSLGQLSGAIGASLSGVGIYLLGYWVGKHHLLDIYPLYILAGVGYFIFFMCVASIIPPKPLNKEAVKRNVGLRFKDFFSGVSYLREHNIILGALLLDLLAVLFGGATALLSVYAYKILGAGPIGYGLLRSATPIGAMCMALWHMKHPPMTHPGKRLIASVIGFGIVTICFGYSRWLWLSVLLMVILGALDNISVVIRSLLLSFYTKEAMRGRVLAISNLFVNMSNELGELESGELAHHIGAVGSVVLGGMLSIVCTVGVAFGFPALFRLPKIETDKNTGR